MKPQIIRMALLALLLGCLLPVPASAAPPWLSQMNYQGQLTDSAGNAVADGTYSLIFKIYDAPSGGSSIWGPETQSSVLVSKGLFNVILGSGGSPMNVLTGAQLDAELSLTVTVSGDTEMTPRQLLLPSMQSRNAQYLRGLQPNNSANNLVVLDSSGKIPSGLVNSGSVGVPLDLSGSVPGGTAIRGWNTGGTNSSYGIQAQGYNGLKATVDQSAGVGVSATTYSGGDTVASAALWGSANSGVGVVARSVTGLGLSATSQSGTAVYGEGNIGGYFTGAASSYAVYGQAPAGATYGTLGDKVNNTGVYGNGVSGNHGVTGRTSGVGSFGVWGDNTNIGAAAVGVKGTGSLGVSGVTNLGGGRGVSGDGSSLGYGVYGITSNASYAGVFGTNTGSGAGVYGTSGNVSGFGVRGENSSLSGAAGYFWHTGTGAGSAGTGVKGESGGSSGRGVWGRATGSTGRGVVGESTAVGAAGGEFISSAMSGSGSGIIAQSSAPGGYGVNAFSPNIGVYGEGKYGIYGFSDSSGTWAVYADANDPDGVGMRVQNNGTGGPSLALDVYSAGTAVGSNAIKASGGETVISASGGSTGLNAIGTTYGVYATGGGSYPASGVFASGYYGGHFQSSYDAVWAESTGAYGLFANTSASSGHAVHALANGSSGIALWGSTSGVASSYGIKVDAACSSCFGAYISNPSPTAAQTGYALYVDGKLKAPYNHGSVSMNSVTSAIVSCVTCETGAHVVLTPNKDIGSGNRYWVSAVGSGSFTANIATGVASLTMYYWIGD